METKDDLNRFKEMLHKSTKEQLIEIIGLPRKLIQDFKIDNTANQIKTQTMTLSAVAIGKFHDLKDLYFCVNIFYQNTLARNTVVLSLFVIRQLAALGFLLRRFAVLMK